MIRSIRKLIVLFAVLLISACQPTVGTQGVKPASSVTPTLESNVQEITAVSPTPDVTYRKPPTFGYLESETKADSLSIQITAYRYDETSRILFVRVRLKNNAGQAATISPGAFSIAGLKSPGLTATYFEDKEALTSQVIASAGSAEGNLAFGPISQFDSYELVYYSPSSTVVNIPLN